MVTIGLFLLGFGVGVDRLFIDSSEVRFLLSYNYCHWLNIKLILKKIFLDE